MSAVIKGISAVGFVVIKLQVAYHIFWMLPSGRPPPSTLELRVLYYTSNRLDT